MPGVFIVQYANAIKYLNSNKHIGYVASELLEWDQYSIRHSLGFLYAYQLP